MLRYNSTPYIEVFQADKKRIIAVKKMETTIASHVRERESEGFAEYRRKRK